MLTAPGKRRERVLVFGESGSGKSNCWVNIAWWLKKTKSDGTVLLFDTDEAYEAMYDDWMDNVVCYRADPFEFGDWARQLRKVKKEVRDNDWLVVDMVDKAWTGAQDWFWHTVAGGDSLAEIYLRNRTDSSFDMGGSYGSNWGDINRIYDEFMGLFINMPCHKLALAPARQVMVNPKTGDAVNRNDAEWVRWQFKPTGQSRLSHAFHTILMARQIPRDRGNEWNLTTVKERGPLWGGKQRDSLIGEPVTTAGGFVMTYLTKIGGWTL